MIDEDAVMRFETALRTHMTEDADATMDFKIEAMDGGRLRCVLFIEGPVDRMIGAIEADLLTETP